LILAAALTIGSGVTYAQTTTAPLAPELTGLGTLHVAVTTRVPRAQQFFDQGVRLLYAFNHAEALRAFREAARLDPDLAMAYWGQAIALGPNINAPMTPPNATLAYDAAQRAGKLAGSASARERALIDAVGARYAADGAGDRAALDKAYAAAMARAASEHPDDPDVQTLFADAVMNTMPWDYWQKDEGAEGRHREDPGGAGARHRGASRSSRRASLLHPRPRSVGRSGSRGEER
jgi:hypothetical protein